MKKTEITTLVKSDPALPGFLDLSFRELVHNLKTTKEKTTVDFFEPGNAPRDRGGYETHAENTAKFFGKLASRKINYSVAMLAVVGQNHELMQTSDFPWEHFLNDFIFLERLKDFWMYGSYVTESDHFKISLHPEEIESSKYGILRSKISKKDYSKGSSLEIPYGSIIAARFAF